MMVNMNPRDDQTTLRPTKTGGRKTDTPDIALTLLHHPDHRRVGERVRFPAGQQLDISRLEPIFRTPRGAIIGPLDDPFLSRTPIHMSTTPQGSVSLRGRRGGWSVDGVGQDEGVFLGTGRVEGGVVIGLGDRVVLLLHRCPALNVANARHGLVGDSAALEDVRRNIDRVASQDVPVLVRGETGVGKEIVASAIHRASDRSAGPFVAVNMAALSASTAASELFGHVRGAFTGADRANAGLFGRADGGTLFLDEIGETASEIQPLLLRALESGEIQPVGGAPRRVDVRVVTATDLPLEDAVASGKFRSTLYHRLAGWTIDISPLRERKDDLGVLLLHFLRESLKELGSERRLAPTYDAESPWLSAGVVAALAAYKWPGNVRELRQLSREMATRHHDRDEAEVPRVLAMPTPTAAPPRTRAKKTEHVDGARVAEVLEKHQYRLGPTALELKIARNTLYSIIEKTPGLRTARDLDAGQITEAIAASTDIDSAAANLRVSTRGLRLRMTALGIDR